MPELKLAETLETNSEVYLACVSSRLGVVQAQIQESDFWVGGDPGGWTDDSNVYFETPQQAEDYYNRTYKQVFVFEDEYEAEEKCDELEAK